MVSAMQVPSALDARTFALRALCGPIRNSQLHPRAPTPSLSSRACRGRWPGAAAAGGGGCRRRRCGRGSAGPGSRPLLPGRRGRHTADACRGVRQRRRRGAAAGCAAPCCVAARLLGCKSARTMRCKPARMLASTAPQLPALLPPMRPPARGTCAGHSRDALSRRGAAQGAVRHGTRRMQKGTRRESTPAGRGAALWCSSCWTGQSLRSCSWVSEGGSETCVCAWLLW
jgi:hypothetical protein